MYHTREGQRIDTLFKKKQLFSYTRAHDLAECHHNQPLSPLQPACYDV